MKTACCTDPTLPAQSLIKSVCYLIIDIIKCGIFNTKWAFYFNDILSTAIAGYHPIRRCTNKRYIWIYKKPNLLKFDIAM
jgi:hypothetical protein